MTAGLGGLARPAAIADSPASAPKAWSCAVRLRPLTNDRPSHRRRSSRHRAPGAEQLPRPDRPGWRRVLTSGRPPRVGGREPRRPSAPSRETSPRPEPLRPIDLQRSSIFDPRRTSRFLESVPIGPRVTSFPSSSWRFRRLPDPGTRPAVRHVGSPSIPRSSPRQPGFGPGARAEIPAPAELGRSEPGRRRADPSCASATSRRPRSPARVRRRHGVRSARTG